MTILPPSGDSGFDDNDENDKVEDELSTDQLISKGFEKHLENKDEEALTYFNKALKDPDCPIKALSGKADALKWLERYDEAVKVYEKYFRKDMNSERLLVNCGLCYSQLSETEREVWCYKKSLEANPDYFWGNWNLSIHYLNSGDDKKAFEYTKICCRLDPEYDTAHFNLACYLARFGFEDEALDKLEEVIERFGDEWKKSAIEDEYFDSVRNTRRFKELTGLS